MGLLDYLGGNGGLLPFDQQWMLANGAQSQPGTGGYSAFPGYLPITQGAPGYNGRVLPQDDPQGAFASAPGGVPMPQPRPEGLGTGGILPGGPQPPPPQMPLWMQAGAQGTPPGIQLAQPPQPPQGGLGSMLGGLFGIGGANAQGAPSGSPGIGDRLQAGLMGFANGGAPIPALANLISGLATGQRSDPRGQALQTLHEQQTATYQALRQSGLPHGEAMAAALNPEVLKTVAPQIYTKPTWGVISEDALGKHYGWIDPNKRTTTSGDSGGVGGVGGMSLLAPGVKGLDPYATGDAYLAQFSPEIQAIVKAHLNGDQMPTGNPRTQGMIPFAKTVATKYASDMGIPFNDQTYAAKRKMQVDLASSGNSSIGGIISNGKSAFEHLANLSDKYADLGSYNSAGPMSGATAYIGNYADKVLTPSTKDLEKIKAANDNALKYGQESTKFYAGSGGGEGERMHALKDINPATASSNEKAGFLQTEKELMLGRLRQKEAQIRETLGQDYLDKHPVMTKDLQEQLDKIDANIAYLHGEAPRKTGTSPPTVAAPAPPVAGAKQAPDLNWYIPDPKRPGKYLMVK